MYKNEITALLFALKDNDELNELYEDALELGFSNDSFLWAVSQGIATEAVNECKRYKQYCEQNNIEFGYKQFIRAYKRFKRGVVFEWNLQEPPSIEKLTDIEKSSWSGFWYGTYNDISEASAEELLKYGEGIGNKTIDIWVALGYIADDRNPEFECCGKKPRLGWKYCPYCGTKIPNKR